MSGRRQLRTALGVLATSGALRHAVHDLGPAGLETAMTLARPAKPWSCRLNLHHHWETRTTEDGGRYQACARCGKERPPAGGRVGVAGLHKVADGGALPAEHVGEVSQAKMLTGPLPL
jgi:hypothetical protein